ncbi:hypothetical protein [Nocardiopsis alba]|uniref:hypothetical protein n=1 Tax=Nocardiopsis alba TaxID=53437 RepID=UPI003D731938
MTTTEQPSATRAPEFVGFADVRVGDTLTFSTRDNGFGGSGGRLVRTGVVTGTTARTVTVKVTGYNPLAPTARLRAADWSDRNVLRLMEARRRPHAGLAAAMRRLIDQRHDDPLGELEIVTSELVLEPLPDDTNTRQPDLVDLYRGGDSEYRRAMGRLAASALRRTSA